MDDLEVLIEVPMTHSDPEPDAWDGLPHMATPDELAEMSLEDLLRYRDRWRYWVLNEGELLEGIELISDWLIGRDHPGYAWRTEFGRMGIWRCGRRGWSVAVQEMATKRGEWRELLVIEEGAATGQLFVERFTPGRWVLWLLETIDQAKAAQARREAEKEQERMTLLRTELAPWPL